MASRDGKDSIEVYTEKCNPQIFSTTEDHMMTSEAKEIARSILDNVLNISVTDSTDIAFDFVKEK